MPDQSARIHDLAKAHGAAFSFDCRPCGRHKFYSGEELKRFVARVPAEETLKSLRARMICPRCKMPVDGDFRRFEYSCQTDPNSPEGSGQNSREWSGRR